MPVLSPYESIIGGRDVEPGASLNYQVVFLFLSSIRCGGFILSRRYAGTAAHCVVKTSPESLRVGYGSVDLATLTVADVESLQYHPKFNESSGEFDIGLVKIVGEFRGNNVAAIPLAQNNLAPGTPLIVSGWGNTGSILSQMPMRLQSTRTYLKPLKWCRDYFRPIDIELTENLLCTRNAMTAACAGDSGGPLTFNGTLVGIVSWGDSTCLIFPTVFTNVTAPKVKGWLEYHLKL